jgi:hypothetical protein
VNAIALDLILVGVAIVWFGFLIGMLHAMLTEPPKWLGDLVANLFMAGFLAMISGFVMNILGEQ